MTFLRPRRTFEKHDKPCIVATAFHFGILDKRHRRYGAEWVGPCPVDGGRDRFGVNIREGLWNCRGCRVGGDVFDLIQHVFNVDFAEALRMLGYDVAGGDRPQIIRPLPLAPAAVPDDDGSGKRAEGLALFEEAADSDHPLVRAYFAGRKLDVPSTEDIRFHPQVPFGGPYRLRPCVLALFRDIVTNEPRAVQFTALKPDGSKISRLTYGSWKGCAIKICADEEIEHGLVIGEGLETCLAGMRLGYAPAWSVHNDIGIRDFPVLPQIEALTILVDADEEDPKTRRRPGQDAALECSARWCAAGRQVWREVPRKIGFDVADVWEKEHRHEG
jgi:hypothetical protein